MKIIQIFPGKIWGGAEQYVLDLGTALMARGHELVYLSRPVEAITKQMKLRGMCIGHLPFVWAFDRPSIKGLSRVAKDADVIHVHNVMFVPIAVLARKRAGSHAKIILTRHDAHRTPVNIFYRHLFKKIDGIIFVSDLARRAWCGVNRWFPTEKCHVVINSIPDYNFKETESLRDKFGIDNSIPLIFFSGRVKKTKGCEVLIKALCRIADRPFAMVFVGAWNHRDYDKKLLAIAEKAGISDRIHFYGFSPDARQLVRQADIAVAPSVFRDPCPLSNIEYIKNGVCEVTTDNGGQAEYLTDGKTALLVPPGDDAALAQAIARLLDSPELRNRLARAGKEYFETNMTYDKFVDKITNVYQ